MRRCREVTFRAACALAVLAVCACTVPKHSNTLVFGTNTMFALNATYDAATQGPGITVGLKRQELVWLPLYVNKAAVVQKDQATTNEDSKAFESAEGQDKDAYSVIASFGTKHSASYSVGKSPEVSGEISQFIATGRAAVWMAKKSGDRLVSTSQATTTAAQATTNWEARAVTLAEQLEVLCAADANTLDAAKVTEFKAKYKYEDLFDAATTKKDVLDKLAEDKNRLRAKPFERALQDYAGSTKKEAT